MKAREMMIFRPVFLLGVALVFCVGVGSTPTVEAAKPKPSFFRSIEVKSSNLKPFKRWRAVLKRHLKARTDEEPVDCAAGKLNICSFDDWDAFVESVRDKPPMAQLRAVNKRLNNATYVVDAVNWGKKDYWAAPAEFLQRFGDCEDYAIFKYKTLKMLGWAEEDLRIVAVNDLNLKVGHAVLIVFTEHKSKRTAFLLDNQIKRVVNASFVKHYQPIYSLNQDHWWKHVVAKKKKK